MALIYRRGQSSVELNRKNQIVWHVGVLAKNVKGAKYGDKVPVYQMEPPLSASLLPLWKLKIIQSCGIVLK